MERLSPTEENGTKSKKDIVDDMFDAKDHVNVIFIGHVGKFTFLNLTVITIESII